MDTNAPGEKKAPGAVGQLAPGPLENHAANLPQPLADSNEIHDHIFGMDTIFSDSWTESLWYARDPHLDCVLAGNGYAGDPDNILRIWRPIFPPLPDRCYRWAFLKPPTGAKWMCSMIWKLPYYRIVGAWYYQRLPYRKRRVSK